MLVQSNGTDTSQRQIDHLLDAERLLSEALVTAQESVSRCEQALSKLAELRSQVAHMPAPTACTVIRQMAPAPIWNKDRRDYNREVEPMPHSLTPREIEVLQLIAIGCSNRQIADALSISPRTIERHVANIYLKIDVHNKAEATSYALRHHLT